MKMTRKLVLKKLADVAVAFLAEAARTNIADWPAKVRRDVSTDEFILFLTEEGLSKGEKIVNAFVRFHTSKDTFPFEIARLQAKAREKAEKEAEELAREAFSIS